MAETAGKKKTLVGSVTGGKTEKTVIVTIERLARHPLYGKYVKKRVKYMVHDEAKECKTGDKVMIIESRPLSKTKRWRVKEILEKAK